MDGLQQCTSLSFTKCDIGRNELARVLALQSLVNLELNEIDLSAFCSTKTSDVVSSHVSSLQIKGVKNVHVFLKKIKFCDLKTLKLISCGITSSQLMSSGIELLGLHHLNVAQNAIDDEISKLL